MKRMVENSEKLEELVGTLNIVTEKDYYGLNGSDFTGIYVFNLGTALIVNGFYDPGNGDKDINVMTINYNLGFEAQMLSNGDEIYAYTRNNDDGTDTVMINFDHTRADVSKSEYSFSFILGRSFKQLWEDY